MGAEIHDPAAPSGDAISVTAAARAHLARQIAKEGAEAVLLDITESGCNGYMYALSFVGHAPDDARAFDFGGVRVFVPDAHLALVRGTEVDYVTSGLNAALKFANPNATGECGCGESFSLGAVDAVDAAPAG